MELLKPEHEIRNQEIANFVAAVVENQSPPFLVLTDAGITVFVEMGAVEEGETVGILGEVPWNPVDDHADAFSVAAIHKGAEFIGCAVATGRCVPTGHLVAP